MENFFDVLVLSLGLRLQNRRIDDIFLVAMPPLVLELSFFSVAEVVASAGGSVTVLFSCVGGGEVMLIWPMLW